MRKYGQELSARRVCYMTHSFPLTMDQLQEAIMPAEPLKQIRWLNSEGVCGVSSSHELHIRLSPAYLPGLQRYSIMRLNTPVGVYPRRNNHYYSGAGPAYKPTEHEGDLTLNEGYLSEDARIAVRDWANRAVKECRLEILANKVVDFMLDRVATTGDVLARWPFLVTLVEDKPDSAYGYGKLWRQRLRNGPRDLRRYTCNWDEATRAQMEATEVFLNSAMLLDEYEHPKGTMRAEMVAWEKLPKDRV